MTHASLCTGLGAAELAATWLGWDNIFMSEIDEFCRKILKFYFPNTKLHRDITKESFLQYRGLIDVLTAGFPCQPFSLSGDRKGADDHRFIWPSVYSIVDEVRPPWFIGENVAGLTSMVQPISETKVESQSGIFETLFEDSLLEGDFILSRICSDLEKIGYSVQPFIIPACAVGAPHRRDRIWIIAHCADAGTENVQRGRKDGFLSSLTSTNSNGNDAGRCGYGEAGCSSRKSKIIEEQREWVRSYVERISKEKNAPNTTSGRPQGRSSKRMEYGTETRTCKRATTDTQRERGRQIFKEVQSQKSGGKVTNTFSDEQNASDSNQFNGNDGRFCAGEISQLEAAGIFGMPGWEQFPTQSPLCSGDDGISSLLDGITFSSWRRESVKGYGNAIVPQDLYEIFNIINQITT